MKPPHPRSGRRRKRHQLHPSRRRLRLPPLQRLPPHQRRQVPHRARLQAQRPARQRLPPRNSPQKRDALACAGGFGRCFFLAGAFCLTLPDGFAVPAFAVASFGVAAFPDFAKRSCAAVKLFCKPVIMVDLSRFDRERSSTCACKSSFTFAKEAY